nr:hypothetical protein [uncultured Arsenicibacter sp.]
MDIQYFYAQYGVDPANLNDSTKKKINEVLGAMGYAGLDKLGKIIQEEAAKQSGTTGTKTSTESVIDTSADQVLQEEEARKARQRMYIIVGSVIGVLAIGIVLFFAFRKRKPNER